MQSNVLKFVIVLQVIQGSSYGIMYLLATNPVFMPFGLVLGTTLVLCALNLGFVRGVYRMTKRVTDSLGLEKECNPLMKQLLGSRPRLVKLMPSGTVLAVFGFILVMQWLVKPTSIVALYIPLVMTCATGIDYANDLYMCRTKYRSLFTQRLN